MPWYPYLERLGDLPYGRELFEPDRRIEIVQHGSLKSFLNGERSADELWREIKPEVKDCVASCAKGGAGAVNFGRTKDANLTLPGGGAHICAC